MPIEIRELVIRATIDQEPPGRSRTVEAPQSSNNNAENNLVRQLIKMIKEQNER